MKSDDLLGAIAVRNLSDIFENPTRWNLVKVLVGANSVESSRILLNNESGFYYVYQNGRAAVFKTLSDAENFCDILVAGGVTPMKSAQPDCERVCDNCKYEYCNAFDAEQKLTCPIKGAFEASPFWSLNHPGFSCTEFREKEYSNG